jgi:hypothetical protein
MSNGGAAAEGARAKEANEAAEAAAVEASEAHAGVVQAFLESEEGSERQAVRDQIAEAEAAMRGDNTLIGTPGDPTKGPAS